jgi:hypothetical protein
VYERDGQNGVYAEQTEKRRTYALPLMTPQAQAAHVTEHRRVWHIECRNGLARVEVTLADLDLRGPLTLGIVTPPFCNIKHDGRLTTTTTPLKVNRHNLPDERVQFELVGDQGTYRDCRWSYSVSNAAALDRRDLDSQQSPERWSARLDECDETLPHTVRFPCDRLTLVYEFNGEDEIIDESYSRVVVERRATEHGPERWDHVPAEESRGRIEVTSQRVEYTIESPLVGLRYAPVFRLKRKGPLRSSEGESIVSDVLRQCCLELAGQALEPVSGGDIVAVAMDVSESTPLGELTRSANALAERLNTHQVERLPLSLFITRAIEHAVLKHLDLPWQMGWLGAGGAWVGMLWSARDSQRLLFPAFGSFPNATWNVSFPYGVGVAGQSFRFCGPAAYVQNAPYSDMSLIFRSRTETGASVKIDYEWILSFPLNVPGVAPVGVITFAATDHSTDAAAQLHQLAEEIVLAKGWEDLDQPKRDLCRNLQDLISIHFWKALVDRGSPTTHVAYASKVVQRFLSDSVPPRGTQPHPKTAKGPGKRVPPRKASRR